MKLIHVIGKGLLALVLCITSMIAVSSDVIAEDVTYPVKGDWIKILVDDSEYRVAKQTSDGDHTFLVSSFEGTSMKWNTTASNIYTDSAMQEFMLQVYNNMPPKKKNAVVEQPNLKQHRYRMGDTPVHSSERDFDGQKYVYLLDVQDVLDYVEGISGSGPRHKKMRELFFKGNDTWSSGENVWLLSAHNSYNDSVYKVYRNGFDDNDSVRNYSHLANPAFVVDLDELAWTVKFDLNGGAPEIEDQKIYLWTVNGGTTNDKAKKPVPDPTRDGYEFQYWYLDDENTPFDFENTSITDDITLTAKWLRKYVYDWVNNVQTWTKGTSTGTIDLEFKRMKDGEPFHDRGDSTWGSTYEWFDLFFVKDSVLDESNYSIEEGSVIVKLNSDYLNSLDAGTYDCSAQFIDEGEATCQFIVKDKVSPSPKPTVKPAPKPSKVVIQTPVAVPNTDTK